MSSLVKQLQIGSGSLKVVVKDTIDIAGFPTCAASPALADAKPAAQHAQVIEHLLTQDCQIIGKANLHELAFGITGVNGYTGTPINPNYPALIPGGSSSGSAAAVAASLCDFSIGTDTGGSIRLPAACCGIIGFKPSFGRIHRHGVLPTCSSLDCIGPMARSMPMLIQAMQCMDPTFEMEAALQPPLAPLKMAMLQVSTDPQVELTLSTALAQLHEVQLTQIQSQYLQAAHEAGLILMNYENWQSFSHLLFTGKLGADIRQRLLSSSKISRAEYSQAQAVQQQFRDEIEQLLQQHDVLVLPTLAVLPPALSAAEQPLKLLDLTRLVRPFNVSGHPAMSLPLKSSCGMPVGLQLVAAQGQDEKLCAMALSIEQQLKAVAQDSALDLS